MDYNTSSAAHASTSGLQSLELDSVKNYREEEEYDFEYESDCYADSDTDIGHMQRVQSDLERWRCRKCNKTFKSLKEKLLHSGHHSPCILEKAVGTFNEENLASLENVSNESLSQRDSNVTFASSFNAGTQRCLQKDSCLAKSSSKEQKSLKNEKIKRKIYVEKFKEENKDVKLIEDWRLTKGISTSTGEFKCMECSALFDNVEKLHDHRVTALKSRYICPICHLTFRKRSGKLRHLKLHPISELKCSICHRNFDSFYAWSQHQLFHMGLIVYECKECGHKCQRKGELEIHYRKHSGERPFKCETCLNTFVSNHSLKRHLVVHMKGQEIECDICHKRYKNAIGLSKHKLKMHLKKKKFLKKRTDFMCDVCNEVFHSERKLAWHREIHERWPKKCQQCGECFIHQSNLTKHIRFKHDASYIPEGSQKENINCPVCKKTYKRSSLSLHMRTHTGVKPYKCSVCGKEFTVKCNYLAHQWIHTGVRDRPYKCKLCEKSFHRQRFLEAHVRSHKKIRPYTCNECGKSFIHKSNFQTHSKLHTEDKQHECGYCGKTFFRKYNLNNHVRIHTGETPFECTICKKEFTQKSNFNVHMKAFHVERHAIHEEV